MIPLFRVDMDPAIKEPLNRVLQSGYIAQGRVVDEFETALIPWFGRLPVSVNSGTAALTMAYHLAGIRGKKVITTPMTCSATNLPILTGGGVPVWADINPRTGLIDPSSVKDLVREIGSAQLGAIVAVDWGGQPADYDELAAIAKPLGIPLIEDAAHAFGAFYKDRPVGVLADYTCFSFQAIKHLTTGDGGAIVTPYEQAKRARDLRWFGIDREVKTTEFRGEVDIVEAGYKFHMNDIAATIGLANLRLVDGVLTRHRRIAATYNNHLDERFTRTAPIYDHTGSWWIYTVLLPSYEERQQFKLWMADQGVQVSQVHWRNDTLSVFAPYRRDLPGVDEFGDRMIAIPCHTGVNAWDVVDAANRFWG